MPLRILISLLFSIICTCFLISDASAEDCPNYLQAARADISKHVAAMQGLEHEASDRLKGLDSRPFDVLLGQARKTAAETAMKRLEEMKNDCTIQSAAMEST